MGQAWCKEKSAKAQDSKSPLDRVFVRCAHRIYPSLKEEGSVLGATQRVTSSEIAYAGGGAVSAPRAGRPLQRGHSIDSVDRPFHPSEWVDVNLEVPCTPRPCVALDGSGHYRQLHQTDSGIPGSNGKIGASRNMEAVGDALPVPPPRRRRRHEMRSPPGEANDESEPELLTGPADQPTNSTNEANSDDEFVEIEKSLLKEEAVPAAQQPKSQSAASLPNVVDFELLPEDPPAEMGEGGAKRPPRQKTSSLPRDSVSLEVSDGESGPEGGLFPSTTGVEDNSIFKTDTSSSLVQLHPVEDTGFHAKTSTPVKPVSTTASADVTDEDEASTTQSLDAAFESFANNHPSALENSRDLSPKAPSRSFVVVGQDVDRPASPRSEDDGGYASRSDTRATLTEASSSDFHEASSGIIPNDAGNDGDISGLVVIQRTISEESLPREMLVEELDEEPRRLDRQTSELEDYATPSPSPEVKRREIGDGIVNGFVDLSVEAGSPGVPTEATEGGKSEPRIVPVKRPLPFGEQPPRVFERTNPFLDDHDGGGEVPKHTERLGSAEETTIEEPLIVPTPPRRRHRHKSSLESPMEPEALHTYASRDRLI
ncbi:uncharacterized protein LOC106640258 isoform X2 [Copidosoma floridanum]|uniref:uncharacterized protein LOC106640258 isoform X2 n=1 Tax=Copidosoma floridanum TaxID=29053 RepID=UPI0006C9579B|nr:uncharacterized protein LOC106640258 isoform X2 [Copidosoma floridanum]